MDLPLWLNQNSSLAPAPSKFKQSNFIQKTLQGIIVRESVYSEEIALRSGFLQAMDPRMKLLTIFSFLITVNLLRHLPLLWRLYLAILILATLSKVPPRLLIQGLVSYPLFTGIMVIKWNGSDIYSR